MRFLRITLTVFPITIFIIIVFLMAYIANAGTTNEIVLNEKYEPGDWVVSNTTMNSSEIKYLEGNLTIEVNGNLTLDNVTLIFNCVSDGQYHIEIKNGGELHIRNNSAITRGYKYNYLFWVRAGAKLTMENSSLRQCGYKGDSESDYGLYICSPNVLIKNCILEENYWGVYYVQNTSQPEKARIENNIIINNDHGISVYGGRYRYAGPYIANNTISNSNGDGIYCKDDHSEIINNTITYNGENGIFCEGSYANMENNILVSNYKYGIGVTGGSYIEKITGNKIENSSSYALYCYSTATTTSILNLADNTILNGSVGICCEGASVSNIHNNTIKNLSSSGIYIVHARSECSISWNNITECSKGIYCDDTGISPKNKTFTYNNISFSTHSAIYCKYSSPQITTGNKFSNNQLAINLSCGSAEVDYSNNTFENNAEGILLQEWYLKVNVRVDSDPEGDVQVTVKNKLGGAVVNKLTCSAGYIEEHVAEYKILNNYSKECYTPHSITGYKQYVGSDSKPNINITNNTEDVFLFLKIPDLMPTDPYTIGDLTEGNIITVGAHIYNNGTMAASNTLIVFLCDNITTIGTLTRNISAQSSENVSVQWTAVNGSHELRIAVDTNNSIEERVEDNNNISLPVYVNMKPTAGFTIQPQAVFTYENITFNASLSIDPDGSITEYLFDFGDSITSGWGNSPIILHSYTEGNKTYTPKLRVKDIFGAESDWRIGGSITVKNRPPVPNITASATDVNTNVTIIFDGAGSYDGEALYGGEILHPIANYTWSMEKDVYRYGVIISYSYSENGVYNVTLTVRDNDNEERTAFLHILVNNRLPTSFFSIDPVVGYVTTIFTLNASGSADPDGSIIKYYWDFDDGTILETNQSIITHQFTDDRNYTITLVVQDNDLTNTTVKMVLRILNTQPTTLFSLNKGVVFVNEQVEFNASLSFDLDDEISNYTWDFGDGTKGYGILVNHTYTQLGRYFVTLIVFDDEVNTTHSMVIKINPLPTWIELHYKEVYLVGAIFCMLGTIFFSLRWYEEAKRKEKEVKLWAEKKKKLKTIDERVKEWAKKKEKEKVEKALTEWVAKKEEKKRKD